MSVNKRKKNMVTMNQKLEAIKKLDSGCSIKSVAKMYGVGKVTVWDWRRQKKKIEEWCSKEHSTCPGRKTMKTSDYEDVGNALFLWFTQQRSKGNTVSGPILQEKAKVFAKKLPNTETFTASAGWLHRWKQRYGIRQWNICGERLSAESADTSSLDIFKTDIDNLIKNEQYTLHQIYNCTESELHFKTLPRHKMNKERVIIMACSNASGEHKLPLMVVGKSPKSETLMQISANAIPVYYRHQQNTFIDGALFQEWFFEQFVSSVETFLKAKQLPIKALLLIDNDPSHPVEQELRKGEIVVKFIPPNVTRVLQPIDQSVIENLKKHYRHFLLEAILENQEMDVRSAMRKITLKHVVNWISQAWDNVHPSTISKSCSKLISCIKMERIDEDDDISLYELLRKIKGYEDISQEEAEQWNSSDNIEQKLNNEEIVHMCEQTLKTEEESDSAEVQTTIMTHQEGFVALEAALCYVEQQLDATAADILFIKRWRDTAAIRGQIKIDGFIAF